MDFDFEELDKLIEELEQELSEMNATGNLDGGAGPPKSPRMFKKSKGTNPDEEPDHDSIEVFDYKKTKNKKMNTESKSTYKKMINQMHIKEAKYRDYKANPDASPKQKVNRAIKEVSSKLYEIERICKQNVRLKNEAGVDNAQYWKTTRGKMGRISERILKIAKHFRDLSA